MEGYIFLSLDSIFCIMHVTVVVCLSLLSVDSIPSPSPSSKSNKSSFPSNPDPTFGSQKLMWEKVKPDCDDCLQEDNQCLGIICVGGSGSGKSYTLFGDMTAAIKHANRCECNYLNGENKSGDVDEENRGLVPRFVDHIFHIFHTKMDTDPQTAPTPAPTPEVAYILLQMYLILDEKIIDLLHVNTTATHHHTGDRALACSSSLGMPLVLPAKLMVANSSLSCLQLISMGLRTCALMMLNSVNFFASPHLVLSCHCVSLSLNRVSKFIFVETSSMFTPPLFPLALDRFRGEAKRYLSARELFESVKPSSSSSSATSSLSSNTPSSSSEKKEEFEENEEEEEEEEEEMDEENKENENKEKPKKRGKNTKKKKKKRERGGRGGGGDVWAYSVLTYVLQDCLYKVRFG